MVGERATEGDAETSWEDGRGAERTAALELVAREKLRQCASSGLAQIEAK